VDSPVAFFLLAVAGICLTGAFGEIVFRKTQIPDVLWLIGLGVVLGPVTGAADRESLTRAAPFFAALTLVVVLFEGGSKLKLGGLSHFVARSGVLALLTFVASVLAVTGVSYLCGYFGLLPPSFGLSHAVLLGVILGGSSSVIVMPSMALARIEPRTANLVGLESAFTDALCVLGASAMMSVLAPHAPSAGVEPDPIWLALARSLGIGLGIGVVAGAAWILLLRVLRGTNHAYPVTLAALLALYVVIERAGGSAAPGILAFAVVVGNASLVGKSLGSSVELDLGGDVRGVHTQIAFLLKSFFFTFVGAMLGPPWTLVGLGALLAVVLFGARWLAVRGALLGSGLDPARRRLVIVALPRGMAAGVLATLSMAFGITGTEVLATLAFATVLGTILIFSVGFPWARQNAPTSDEALPLDQVPLSGPMASSDTLTSHMK
jgi:cell volume regulation protein A